MIYLSVCIADIDGLLKHFFANPNAGAEHGTVNGRCVLMHIELGEIHAQIDPVVCILAYIFSCMHPK